MSFLTITPLLASPHREASFIFTIQNRKVRLHRPNSEPANGIEPFPHFLLRAALPSCCLSSFLLKDFARGHIVFFSTQMAAQRTSLAPIIVFDTRLVLSSVRIALRPSHSFFSFFTFLTSCSFNAASLPLLPSLLVYFGPTLPSRLPSSFTSPSLPSWSSSLLLAPSAGMPTHLSTCDRCARRAGDVLEPLCHIGRNLPRQFFSTAGALETSCSALIYSLCSLVLIMRSLLLGSTIIASSSIMGDSHHPGTASSGASTSQTIPESGGDQAGALAFSIASYIF